MFIEKLSERRCSMFSISSRTHNFIGFSIFGSNSTDFFNMLGIMCQFEIPGMTVFLRHYSFNDGIVVLSCFSCLFTKQ